MKVLYVGHYKENSGWSQAAIDYILALDKAGVDVVCRAVKLNSENPVLPERIRELDSRPIQDCDVVIQHVLPHLMDYNGRFKLNIGLFIAETLDLMFTGWPARLNTMDLIWVPNRELSEAAKYSGVTVPIDIVHHASDVSKFTKTYDSFSLPPEIKDRYKFYFIGENVRRKHLSAAFVAYFTKFNNNDNVCLVVKTHRGGRSGFEAMHEIQQLIAEIKRNLRMYANDQDYPPYCILTERLPEEHVYAIHQQCDCFVMPSFGEAWCIPAFDAMGFGNYVLATDSSAFKDFLPWECRVHSSQEPVFGHDMIFQDMHNGFDSWTNISISALGSKMFDAYTRKPKMKDTILEFSPNYIEKFSHEYIGKTMKDLICLRLQ